MYPTIRGPLLHNPVTLGQNQSTRRASTSSEDADFPGAPGAPVFAHYPEAIYVAEDLPTRKPRELRAFREHCRLQYERDRVTLVLDQPLERLREYSTSPLNFQNFLWRSRTTVGYFGITEEYHWIRRQIQRNGPDRAILQPAYRVHYTWNEGGWTVTRLPRNHPVNEYRATN